MSRTILSAAIIASCALLGSAAQAQNQIIHSATARVSVADLDLHRETDARLLLERLTRVVDRACRLRDPVLPDRGRDFETCRAEAVAEGVRLVDAPLVSALHRREFAPGRPTGR